MRSPPLKSASTSLEVVVSFTVATLTTDMGRLQGDVGLGCTTGLGEPSLLLLGLVVLGRLLSRRQARLAWPRWKDSALLGVVCGAVLALCTPAWAQGSTPPLSTAIDVQQFKPAPGRTDVLGLHGAGVPGHLSWQGGLFLNYAREPLVFVDPATRTPLARVVDSQLGLDLVGAVGLGDRFELGVVLPLNLQYGQSAFLSTGDTQHLWTGGVGDLRLVPKALLLEAGGLRLGLAVPLVLPTAGNTQLRGQAGLGAQPRLSADYQLKGGTRLLFNGGANLRGQQELLNLSVGNELAYGVGASMPFQVQGHALTGMVSLNGALGLGATGGMGQEEMPLEVQGALLYRLGNNLQLTLGAGRGLTGGYGMPAYRVLGGLSWTEGEQLVARATPPPRDSDRDGLLDPEDRCPSEPEDRDSFQDEDGCLEADNDQDGLADVVDSCPLQAEDMDGFQDEDGCLDEDNDQDGVADAADRCPLQAEDQDSFQDEDGCLEADNDQDGLADAADRCPLEPEVVNGVEDTDGCPDEGESLVKVEGSKILILEKVYFDAGQDAVLERSFPLLKQVAAVLRANPQIAKVRIEGHTDDQGDDAFNLELSQRRADSVRGFLVQEGIAAERLEAVGYGETRPVDTRPTTAGRENNRRVEFTIIEVTGP